MLVLAALLLTPLQLDAQAVQAARAVYSSRRVAAHPDLPHRVLRAITEDPSADPLFPCNPPLVNPISPPDPNQPFPAPPCPNYSQTCVDALSALFAAELVDLTNCARDDWDAAKAEFDGCEWFATSTLDACIANLLGPPYAVGQLQLCYDIYEDDIDVCCLNWIANENEIIFKYSNGIHELYSKYEALMLMCCEE